MPADFELSFSEYAENSPVDLDGVDEADMEMAIEFNRFNSQQSEWDQ